MNKVSINLEKWENALFPIDTLGVDLSTCETLLYEKLTKEFGFSDDDIKQYINGDSDKMCHTVSYLEEKLILENGGKYYD
jgi:hypothetical protein